MYLYTLHCSYKYINIKFATKLTEMSHGIFTVYMYVCLVFLVPFLHYIHELDDRSDSIFFFQQCTCTVSLTELNSSQIWSRDSDDPYVESAPERCLVKACDWLMLESGSIREAFSLAASKALGWLSSETDEPSNNSSRSTPLLHNSSKVPLSEILPWIKKVQSY